METETQSTIDGKKLTIEHIERVRYYMGIIIDNLKKRAQEHDTSKLETPEKEIFGEFSPQLKTVKYGSPEYSKLLDLIKPALESHYRKNNHHPEWFLFQEEWKPVVGYENIYEVSNYGQIRSVTREIEREKMGNLDKKGQILRSCITPAGYCRIQLQKDGACKNFFVHQLVAKAFIPNPKNKPIVNHLNSVRDDNYFLNLEWATHSENLLHAYDEGLKISNAKYVFICDELEIATVGSVKMEKKLKDLGYENASAASIHNCVMGDSETHLDLTFRAFSLENFKNFSYIDRMTLPEILEMFCDWVAATERMKDGGNIHESIDINAKRFNIDHQIVNIFHNTAKSIFNK